jgi:hypothetical protein
LFSPERPFPERGIDKNKLPAESLNPASVLPLLAGHGAELGVAALVLEQLAATPTLLLDARARIIVAVVGVMQCLPTLIAAGEVAQVLRGGRSR